MTTPSTTFKNELKDLDNFLASAELQLNQILVQFNWTKQDLIKPIDNTNQSNVSTNEEDKTLVQCNVDLNHWVPKFKLKEHTIKCKLKRLGLDPETIDEELPSDRFVLQNRDGMVCLDVALDNIPNLVPIEIPDAYNLQPRMQDETSSLSQEIPPPPPSFPPPPPSHPPPPSQPVHPSAYSPVYHQQAWNMQSYQQYMQYPYGMQMQQNYNEMMYKEGSVPIGVVVADEYFPELQQHASLRSNYTRMKRFLLSWTHIPYSYRTLDFECVDKQKILNWLFKFAFKYVPGYAAPTPERIDRQTQPQNVFADEETLNYFLTVLSQNDPERAAKVLTNKFHQNTTEFIVSAWKYIALEVLEARRKVLVDAGQVVEGEFEQDMIFDNVKAVFKGDDYPIYEAIHSDKPPSESTALNASTTYQKYLRYLHDVYVARSIRLNRKHSLVPLNTEYVPKLSKHRETKKKSQLEILQEQREKKKRRKKYRAQNVHITKRTPIMVARDLVNKRMEELTGVSTSSSSVTNENEHIAMESESGYPNRNQPRYPPKQYGRDYGRQDRPYSKYEKPYDRQYDRSDRQYDRQDGSQYDRHADKQREERSHDRQDRTYEKTDHRGDRRNYF